MTSQPRVVFVGAIESSRVALETLLACGVRPIALGTLSPREAHRHSDFVDLRPLALQHSLPVLNMDRCNSPEVLDQLRALAPDLILVIGWSRICRQPFLDIPRRGCIGYHPALLPQNRGRGVIPWTILQQASQTGTTLFWMNAEVDAGDILLQERFDLAPDENAASLYRKHLDRLKAMIADLSALLEGDEIPRIPQDPAQATWCARRRPEDGFIDWRADAEQIWRLIRAVGAPYPGAFTFYRGKKLVVWEASWTGKAPHSALPGQIIEVGEHGALVQCGDGLHITIEAVQCEHAPRQAPLGVLKRHEKLGMSPLQRFGMGG